jgi:hypothetical protein
MLKRKILMTPQFIKKSLACLALFNLMFCASAHAETAIEQDAVAVLKQWSANMNKLRSFKMTMILGYDVVQEDGQRLEFGAVRQIALQKPDKLALNFKSREGKTGMVKFDGEYIYAYNRDENVYAKTEQPGNIAESIEHLTSVLKFPVPAQELFSKDIAATLTENVQKAYITGKELIAGVETHHLALRTEDVDYQLWINTNGPALLRRMVITYKNEPGHPQFWANFINWQQDQTFKSNIFTFTPPPGAERIAIVVDESYLAEDEAQTEH